MSIIQQKLRKSSSQSTNTEENFNQMRQTRLKRIPKLSLIKQKSIDIQSKGNQTTTKPTKKWHTKNYQAASQTSPVPSKRWSKIMPVSWNTTKNEPTILNIDELASLHVVHLCTYVHVNEYIYIHSCACLHICSRVCAYRSTHTCVYADT